MDNNSLCNDGVNYVPGHVELDGQAAGLPETPNLPPCRGLLTAHNYHRRYLRETDIHRWLAYSVRVLDCAKIDVLAWGPIPGSLISTIKYAREFGVPISLRTDGLSAPDGLESLASEGLAGVFLCPRPLEDDSWEKWLEACRRAGLPIRIQLQLPMLGKKSAGTYAQEWAASGVCSVNLVLEDPFQPQGDCETAQEGNRVIECCNELAERLSEHDIEVNIFGIPPELLGASARACAASARAFFHDYQQYDQTSYSFARWLYMRRPQLIRTVLLLEMKRHTVSFHITDRWLTQALFVRAGPVYRLCVYMAGRWRALFGTALSRATNDDVDRPADTSPPLGFSDTERMRAIHRLGGYTGKEADTAAPAAERKRYIDPIDQDRLRQYSLWNELAREAQDWQRMRQPTRVCDVNDWGTAQAFMVPEYGATAWLTFLPGKRESNAVDGLWPPYILSFTIGGGLAEAAGFRLGPSFTLMCPLVEARHTITLYVNKEGRYVLMRDGVPVEAVRRPGQYHAPHRAPSFGEAHIVVWDIEERVSFSPVRIWKESPPENKRSEPAKYSVVLFCTRFARRLAVALQCLVHQRDFDLSAMEVIVGYVPGLDATEDVLGSLRRAYPEMRIVHVTFPMQNIRSKGYVLNRCMDMASGEWLLLLDADTLLPPYMFAALEQVERGQSFIFPRGRSMLDPETTAKILLGEIKPWEAWDDLLQAAPAPCQDEALGVPIGYSQCFRRKFLDKVRYPEYEHFQGADYEFAVALRKHVGHEYRLDFPVLHLDHEGSQWFGAERHF